MSSKKKTLTIRAKLLGDTQLPAKIEVGDWIDLCTSEDVTLKQFEFMYIPLGICMKLPEGYEGILAPRSSTFKKWGILQANSIDIFDESFCGDDDEWKMPAVALRDTFIPKGTRICQFRIMKHMKAVSFIVTNSMNCKSRGGWGTTGNTMEDISKQMTEDM